MIYSDFVGENDVTFDKRQIGKFLDIDIKTLPGETDGRTTAYGEPRREIQALPPRIKNGLRLVGKSINRMNKLIQKLSIFIDNNRVEQDGETFVDARKLSDALEDMERDHEQLLQEFYNPSNF